MERTSRNRGRDMRYGISVIVPENGANRPDSIKLLEENRLQPLTLPRAIELLLGSESLRGALAGKWFWLADDGPKLSAGYYISTATGELMTLYAQDLDRSHLVHVSDGESRPVLLVAPYPYPRDVLRYGFYVYLNVSELASKAPVVVGTNGTRGLLRTH